MKKFFLTGLFAALLVVCFAQKPYTVVFYNLENLFDTINDPETKDEEFLPDGARRWNTAKYNKKLSNIERVLFDIAAIQKEFPAVIGVSEIENRTVLEDLIAQPKLSKGNYRIVHYDSPDARGVDCAFFYRPDQFKLEGSAAIPFVMPGQPNFRTRDFVTMWGTIEGEPFFFLVSHWPSRLGGKDASAPKRMAAAEQCRHIADSVRSANPAVKVVIMGDLNDDATDDSVVIGLGAKRKIKEVGPEDMYNPFIDMLRAGHGTLAYQDAWNLFDNIVISENLATGSTGELKIQKAEGSKFYGNIFRKPYMVQREGQYKGYPLRTFVGTNFQGGYSDHFPVYIYIAK
ncbi:MAG: endonuclease/exonuclease/phosphatase family protein [Alistipes sp.]|nr:endonuclease/exonuclease/phosphatase family protein [Alistipes sp.]